MSTYTTIMNMIKNCPHIEDEQLNPDIIFDFVIEHVSDKNLCRFENMSSIVRWLKRPPTSQVKIKPGTKIVIPKPKPGDVKLYNQLESAQACLKQNSASSSSFDDTEEIDVITADDYTSPWNHYHQQAPPKITPKSPASFQILTVKQRNAPQPPSDGKRPKGKGKLKRNRSDSPDENQYDEPDAKYSCKYCNKKYQQRSSVNRHEKQIHQIEIAIDKPLAKPPIKRKTISGNLRAAIVKMNGLNGSETIYS